MPNTGLKSEPSHRLAWESKVLENSQLFVFHLMPEFVVLCQLQDKLLTVTAPLQAQISVGQFHMFLQPAELKNLWIFFPRFHKQSTGLYGTYKAILGKVVASHVFRQVTGNN